jgi:hypothetical protein
MTAPPESITIGQAHGDLHIQHWQGDNATLRAQLLAEDEPPIDLAPGASVPEIDGDATLFVAGALPLALGDVHGDLVVSHVAGALTVAEVHGDLLLDGTSGPAYIARVQGDANLRDAASATLESVHGDLRAVGANDLTISGGVQGDASIIRAGSADLALIGGDLMASEMHGDLHARQVAGDVRLQRMQGNVRVEFAGDNVAAQELAGNVAIIAEGDAFIETALVAGATYEITAETIVLRARGEISAQFVAESAGGTIHTRLPLTVDRPQQHLVGILGQGEASVTLTSRDGDIILEAAGDEAGYSTRTRLWEGRFGGRRFQVHLDHGPHGARFSVDSDDQPFTWPFGGAFTMSSQDPNTPNTPPTGQSSSPDLEEFEAQMRDLSDRAIRAARKAAEKARDLGDRAGTRARETDWEAIGRRIRVDVERAAAEVASAIREIVSEFQKPSTGAPSPKPGASAGPTAQRIIIENDQPSASAAASTPADAEARRRAILEQLKAGDISLEEAEQRLREL